LSVIKLPAFYTSNFLTAHATFTSIFVASDEPVGVECTFRRSTCGYTLGQQWIFTDGGG